MIRPGRADDAEGVARVQVETWQTAYAHALPPDQLRAMSAEDRVEQWRRMPPIVAEVEGEIVGFVSVGAAREADAEGELYAIYVQPEHWGTGTGRELMEAGEEELRRLGYEQVVLWVLDDNPRARRFYEIAGWVADGKVQEVELFGFQLREVRYAKNLH